MKAKVEETYHLVVSRLELDLLADGLKSITSRYEDVNNPVFEAGKSMSKDFDRLRNYPPDETR